MKDASQLDSDDDYDVISADDNDDDIVEDRKPPPESLASLMAPEIAATSAVPICTSVGKVDNHID